MDHSNTNNTKTRLEPIPVRAPDRSAEPTRVAIIKPSGRRPVGSSDPAVEATRVQPIALQEARKPATAAESQAGEMTVLHAESPRSNNEPAVGAEFIPPSGHRDAAEQTTFWQPENRLALDNALARIRDVLKRKRLFMLLVVASVAVIFTLFAGLTNGKKASSDVGPLPQQTVGDRTSDKTVVQRRNEARVEQPAADQATDPAPRTDLPATVDDSAPGNSAAPADASCRLKDAADALVLGRHEEALEIYRKLSARYPAVPSYRLSVEILERTQQWRAR